MKKVLSLVLAAVMLFSVLMLASCGKDEKADITVGAVYIGSQNEDAGYTFAHHNGITKAIEQLKAEGYNVKLLIRDNVQEDDAQVKTAVDALANQGCDIIFGISFGYLNAFDAAAEEYEDIIFSHATGYLSNATNFNNYFGRIYQARYLSGIAAGLKAKEVGKGDNGKYNIGYVSAYGTQYAETCSGINAFTLGVQSVLGDEAQVYVKQIGTWGDPTLEKQAAEALISTYKCVVIAQHCDSQQPQVAAQNAGVFGCGYNSDMTSAAPQAHLTAPIWNWDVYYKLAIETAMKDSANFMSKVGIYYGGLKEDFVDISPLSENCTSDTAAKIDAVKTMILSGEWDVFSNVKLTFDESGNVVKTNAALITNDGKTVISEDNATYYVYETDEKGALTGNMTVVGGADSVDGIIKGSMNYYVAGILDVTEAK